MLRVIKTDLSAILTVLHKALGNQDSWVADPGDAGLDINGLR